MTDANADDFPDSADALPSDVIFDDGERVWARYWVPVDPHDVTKIQAVVAAADPFRSSFLSRQEVFTEKYSVLTYRHQLARYGTETLMLLDRNIVSRLVNLAQGMDATTMHRSAAGVLAFAQCAGITVDPALALHELAATVGGPAALSEYEPLRMIDDVHAGYLTELALGRAPRLPTVAFSRPGEALGDEDASSISATDLERPLRSYRHNYTVALKIAALELSRATPEAKLACMLDWMHFEFRFSAPTLGFAIRYFASGEPRPNWLQGLRKREKALKRVRNVAWDLTLVDEWLRRVRRAHQNDENVLWILASLDSAVRDVADLVFRPELESDADVNEHLRVRLARAYGDPAGRRLFDRYARHRAASEDPRRALHATGNRFPSSFTESLEHEVLLALDA